MYIYIYILKYHILEFLYQFKPQKSLKLIEKNLFYIFLHLSLLRISGDYVKISKYKLKKEIFTLRHSVI